MSRKKVEIRLIAVKSFEVIHHSPNYSVYFKRQVISEYLAGGNTNNSSFIFLN